MKNIFFVIYLFSIIYLSVFSSCTQHDNSKHDLLKVSLTQKEISISDLFSRAELIPTETRDSSLIRVFSKAKLFEDKLFIMDNRQYKLFIFDMNGKLINQIAKIGQGPGEYSMVYDFVINEPQRQVEMLSPFCALYYYDFDGNFIEKRNLPNPPISYRLIENLDKDHYLTASYANKSDNQLHIISKKTMKIVNQFYTSTQQTQNLSCNPFHVYNNKIFFTHIFSGNVSQVTPDSLTIAYEWDFGDSGKKLREVQNEDYEDYDKKTKEAISNMIRSGEIPFVYGYQFQNDKYYYLLQYYEFTSEKRTSLFYNKNDGSYMLFNKTTEGLYIDPIIFENDFLISKLEFAEKENLLKSEILNETDKEKLKEYKEDDNTWLIKYYFN